MDPVEVMLAIIENLMEGNIEQAQTMVYALREWEAIGGFIPSREQLEAKLLEKLT